LYNEVIKIINETKIEKEKLKADMEEIERISNEEMEKLVEVFTKKSADFMDTIRQDACEQ
jgi:hypothetical protein